jgi:hypothetical protein
MSDQDTNEVKLLDNDVKILDTDAQYQTKGTDKEAPNIAKGLYYKVCAKGWMKLSPK